MRALKTILLFATAVTFLACGEATDSQDLLTGKSISMEGYGSAIESAYYKVWSDSSWEEFGQILSINGTTYATIMDDAGYEYYYSSEGYAGFALPTGDLIMFDQAEPSLPDTLTFGKTYAQKVTFAYQQYGDTITTEQTLVDSGTVTAPIGTFFGCVHFRQKSTMSIGGQSQTVTSEYWLAKGPSDIKRKSSAGYIITMLSGYVNGRNWGSAIPKKVLAGSNDSRIRFFQRPPLLALRK